MIARRFATTLLLVLAVARAGAQDASADPLYRLDDFSQKKIRALIDSAQRLGLPWNALRLKAIEGANKRADGKKVLDVVRKYYVKLAQSKDILGPATDAEIESGASALFADVRPDQLALFKPTQKGRSPSLALVYLADLIVKRGVPRDDAVTALAKAWKDGASDADFDGLWHGIDEDILSGVPPKSALQNRMRALPVRPARPPSDQQQENSRS